MLSNSYTALVTPFTQSNAVDLDALASLVKWHMSVDNSGLVILGTTGERMSLSDAEELAVIETTIKLTEMRISTIANVGCNNTNASIERAYRAKHLGLAAGLAVVPYYNFPPKEGIIAHFEALAAVGLPLIVYHHPKRTGIFLDINTLKTICQVPGVCAIKEASGDIAFATELIRSIELPVFCGDDPLTMQMMKAGAFGTISVISNLIPEEWSKMIFLALQNNFQEAEVIFHHYQTLLDALGLEVNPITVKYALGLMQKCVPNLRLPLVLPQKATQQQVSSVIEAHYPELINKRAQLLN